MPVSPYVVPARDRTEYPEVRVSALSLTQRGVGQPLTISYQIDRYRVTEQGAEDAPAGSTASGTVQKGLSTLVSDPELVKAIEVITSRCVVEAVAAGLLTPKE